MDKLGPKWSDEELQMFFDEFKRSGENWKNVRYSFLHTCIAYELITIVSFECYTLSDLGRAKRRASSFQPFNCRYL